MSGNVAPIYLEVEVKGPMVRLAAGGGSYTFTENWWAAKVRGPILGVDSVGAVAKKLAFSASTKQLSGIYGVFYSGTAKVVFVDEAGEIVAEGKPQADLPLQEFQYQDSAAVPSGFVSAQLRVYDGNGAFVGILDTANASQFISSFTPATTIAASDFHLSPGYPNPFNGGTVLTLNVPSSMRGSLKIYDPLGRLVATLVEGILRQAYIVSDGIRNGWRVEFISQGWKLRESVKHRNWSTSGKEARQGSFLHSQRFSFFLSFRFRHLS